MAYLRRRTIAGGTYLYIVASRRRAGKVRQVTLEYLGREDTVDRKRLAEAKRYWKVGAKKKSTKGKGRRR